MNENLNITELDTDGIEEVTVLVLEDVVREIVTSLQSDTITPYGIAKVLNTVLRAFAHEKVIVPQMMYNYVRNGLIVKGEKGRKEYTADEVVAFANKYLGKIIK